MSRGQKSNLDNIELLFFSKEKDLVKKLQLEKEKFSSYCKEVESELSIKELLIERLQRHNEVLRNEIKLGKRILKNPELSREVNR